MQAREELDDVWNLLSDVCDRYQVHLASVIANRALKPNVAKTMSDIADHLMDKKEPKEVLEIMLRGSGSNFFQFLHARSLLAVLQATVRDSRPRLADIVKHIKIRAKWCKF